MATAVVELKKVSTFTPDGDLLIKDVSFIIQKHEVLLIEGDNGSGKTTLAKAILGLHRQYKGQIELHTHQIDYLPQMGNVQFFLPLSLQDTIAMKLTSSRKDILQIGLLSESSLDRPWNSASGGERQKALLTRAFLSRPDFLVLDEPFNHLDASAREKASTLMAKLADQGCAILLISHLGADSSIRFSQKLTLHRKEGQQ